MGYMVNDTDGRQQAGCGIFLKLHVLETTVRRWIVPIHSVIGKIFPVLGWTRTSRRLPYLAHPESKPNPVFHLMV